MNAHSIGTDGAERRRHRRYQARNETFAFFGEHSGTLVDISEGGFAVQCAVFEQEPVASDHVDLFVAEPDCYLPDLPFSLVGEVQTVPASMFSTLTVKRFSMQFGQLTREQRAQLHRFIADNTVVAADS